MSYIAHLAKPAVRGTKAVHCPECNRQTAVRTPATLNQSARIIPLLVCHHPPEEIPKRSDSSVGYFCQTCFQKLSLPRFDFSDAPPPSDPADLSFIDTVDSSGASLVLWPKPYLRKHDQRYILYLNTEGNKSFPIGESSHVRERTSWQEAMLDGFLSTLDEEATVEFTGSYDAHTGSKNHLSFGIDIYETNNQMVGGQEVPKNGVYIVWCEKLFLIKAS